MCLTKAIKYMLLLTPNKHEPYKSLNFDTCEHKEQSCLLVLFINCALCIVVFHHVVQQCRYWTVDFAINIISIKYLLCCDLYNLDRLQGCEIFPFRQISCLPPIIGPERSCTFSLVFSGLQCLVPIDHIYLYHDSNHKCFVLPR